jgi:ABC-type dipeptide/oligopeptide/nickel transport system permease subunit
MSEQFTSKQRTWFQETLYRFSKNRGALVAAAVLFIVFLALIFASVLAPYSPIEPDTTTIAAHPSAAHWLGTDAIGRDVLSRILFGGRLTVLIGIVAILIALGVGLPFGMIAGYYGGRVDRLISRLMDIMLAFPGILLALAVVAVLGSSVINATIAVGISLIPGFVRLVRGSYLSAKENVYVEAARAIGVGDARIMIKHILPNVLAPITVLATVATGWAIIIGASLSFLGLGVQAPTAEWGADLASGRQWIQIAWWMTTFPGIAILVVILALNLVGDGIRDAIDPRLRNR